MSNRESIERKIKGLLDMARSRAGQPDEEAFRTRALEMMAKYGVNERDLADTSADEMMHEKVSLTGAYTDCQSQLLSRIAQALHCESVLWSRPRSNKINTVEVFGRRKHVQRVLMMFNYLNGYMLVSAKRASLDDFIEVSTVVQRRSWMHGFAHTIATRLKEIEGEQSQEFTTGDKSGDLVLLSDAEAARKARDEKHQNLVRMQSKNRLDARGFSNGSNAGNNVDLGQQRMGGRRALNR